MTRNFSRAGIAFAASTLAASTLAASALAGAAHAQPQDRAATAPASPGEIAVQQTLDRNGITNTAAPRPRTRDAAAAQRARDHMRAAPQSARAPLQIDEDVVVGMPAEAETAERRDPSE